MAYNALAEIEIINQLDATCNDWQYPDRFDAYPDYTRDDWNDTVRRMIEEGQLKKNQDGQIKLVRST